MSLVAGLDVGTQSVKLVVYDTTAQVAVDTQHERLDMIVRDDGSREQDAAWWIAAIRNCFARLPASLRRQVAAIGVSAQQHGFVPLDAAGQVRALVKLWCDTSTKRECDEIVARVGGVRRCVELTGNTVLTGYTASKVRWTRDHRPDVYRALTTILLPHDYVNFWLTGRLWMERGDASGTGWLDVRTLRWATTVLAATDGEHDLTACLPPLAAPDALCPISPDTATVLNVARSVQISAGGGDNMMAAIGTGNVADGTLTMSLGTSGTLFTCTSHPVSDPSARWALFRASTGGWLPLICTMNCTAATEVIANAFGFSGAEGDAVLVGTTPGADGVTMLPFFNGERTPDLPEARASIHGASVENFTRANLYRAAMEAATYTLRYGYDIWADAGLRFDTIRLTGGGSASGTWRQMIANVFNLPVEIPVQPDGAAFGAALQAFWALDHAQQGQRSITEIVRDHVALQPALATRPNADVALAYRGHYQRFERQLHELMTDSAT